MCRSAIYLALFVSALCCSTSVRADLMGYWSFDDDTGAELQDDSGRGNKGTIVGSPALVDGHSGTVGDNSLDFTGSNYVLLGNLADLKIAGDQTIMMWVYPTGIGTRQNPYAKAYGGSGTITQETNGSPNYYHGTSGGNASPTQSHGGAKLTAGDWNHMTLVRDLTNDEVRWYVNGLATARVSPYSAAVPGDLPAYFAQGYVSRYLGRIDDAAIWNEALTGPQVSAIAAGLGTPLSVARELDVVGYTYSTAPDGHNDYYMDEGKDDGSPAGDLTDGILYGGSAVPSADDSRVGWMRNTPVEIIFDLGQSINVTDMMIGYHHQPGNNNGPDDVLVSFSNDGTVFSTPTTYTGFTSVRSRSDLFIDLADTRASYVKLYFDGGLAQDGTPSAGHRYIIDEVAFFSIPEPSTACLLWLGIAGLLVCKRRRRAGCHWLRQC